MLAGLALTGGATISLTWLGPASGYSWFGARLAMPGIGLALALPTVVALLINRVPAGQAGVASGIRLFDHLTRPVELLVTEASGNPHVTHITYRVIK